MTWPLVAVIIVSENGPEGFWGMASGPAQLCMLTRRGGLGASGESRVGAPGRSPASQLSTLVRLLAWWLVGRVRWFATAEPRRPMGSEVP